MPTVAIVDGVKIQFYPNEHPPPHFHAVLAEHIALIDIRTLRVIGGYLPPAKLRAVLEWANPCKTALKDGWAAVETKRKPDKIP